MQQDAAEGSKVQQDAAEMSRMQQDVAGGSSRQQDEQCFYSVFTVFLPLFYVVLQWFYYYFRMI